MLLASAPTSGLQRQGWGVGRVEEGQRRGVEKGGRRETFNITTGLGFVLVIYQLTWVTQYIYIYSHWSGTHPQCTLQYHRNYYCQGLIW